MDKTAHVHNVLSPFHVEQVGVRAVVACCVKHFLVSAFLTTPFTVQRAASRSACACNSLSKIQTCGAHAAQLREEDARISPKLNVIGRYFQF